MFYQKKGLPQQKILALLKKWHEFEKKKWDGTQLLQSGTVYHDSEFVDLQAETFRHYMLSNPLHYDTFVFTMKMETEVIKMTANYFFGTPETCGVMTDGGTGSIILAMKSFRSWALEEKGITEPELIAPVTCHAAFNKAADLLSLKLILLPVDEETFAIKIEDVEKAITGNTIGLVGSMPNYSHGTSDPIEGLSNLARKHNILLHVDACLGSFMVPALKRLGHLDQNFSFDLPGVSTLSTDTHKFGFTAKGTSILLFKNSQLRHHAFFTVPEWTGGMYATPTLPGSRSGGLVACTWAVMVALGQEGYEQKLLEIYESAQMILKGIQKQIPELVIHGNPITSVVAFRFTKKYKKFNIFTLAEAMGHRGWGLSKLQHPNCLHICVTNLWVGKEEKFLQDLRECTTDVLENSEKFNQGASAVYAAGVDIPDSGLKSTLLKNVLDVMLDGVPGSKKG